MTVLLSYPAPSFSVPAKPNSASCSALEGCSSQWSTWEADQQETLQPLPGLSLHLCWAVITRNVPVFQMPQGLIQPRNKNGIFRHIFSLGPQRYLGCFFQDSSRDIREALHELLCCTNVSTKEGIHLALVELLKNLTKYPTDRESIWKWVCSVSLSLYFFSCSF